MRHYSLRRALLSENYSVVGTDKVPATTISPIQRDLNVLHVFGGLKYHRPGGRGRPILCCRDLRDGSLHVIDGHHGWAVACIKNDEVSIKIINADPETIAEDLLDSPDCGTSTPIPKELDLMSNDIDDLISQYGQGLEITRDDILGLPRPVVNGGQGIYKADMPQCDRLRR